MNIFKKIEKGLRKAKDKIVDDIIPNEFKSGEKMKKTIRNLIPNELADVAVDLAPVVAMIPGGAPFAAAMRGIGRFDQRGSISDALKQAAATAAFSSVATPFTSQLPGLSGNTYEGLSGVMQAGKDLGSSAYSGIKSLGTGGKNKALDILGKSGSPKGMPDLSGMGTGGGAVKTSSGGIMDTLRNLGGKAVDMGQEYFLGKDKEFQMGDIGRFLGDPGKTIPLTMIASYIKEKFFPDEDQDSFDAKFAEAMRKRGENVRSYLERSGPFDPLRDPTKNPYSQAERDKFADDLTIEYRNVAADGGIMTVPRENYFLGSLKDKLKRSAKPVVRTIKAQPGSPGAARDVTPDDILNVFKEKFDEGVFFKGRLLPKSVSSTFTANPEMPLPVGTTRRPLENIGKIPKASKVSSDDILNVFKEKFDEGDFSFSSPRLALPMGRKVSSTFSPKQALTAERAFDVDEKRRQIKDFFERRLSGMPERFRPEIMENEEIMELLSKGDRKGLDALMTSLLRDANFDRLTAATGGRMNYARGSEEEMMMASAPDPMDERNNALENLADQYYGKPLRDLSPKEIELLEEALDEMSGGQPLPQDPTKPVNPFAPKPTGPTLPDKLMAFMDDDYEREFMRLVGEFMEQGFTQEEAIEAARDELARIGSKFMADGGRVNYARGSDTPEENAVQAAGIEGLDLNINPKGITELDMRETGGFIPPVGVKEKEDDIPAMLSNNEFVFTADAVRGMGDGDVDKGAERMYSMMKKLEDGGRV